MVGETSRFFLLLSQSKKQGTLRHPCQDFLKFFWAGGQSRSSGCRQQVECIRKAAVNRLSGRSMAAARRIGSAVVVAAGQADNPGKAASGCAYFNKRNSLSNETSIWIFFISAAKLRRQRQEIWRTASRVQHSWLHIHRVCRMSPVSPVNRGEGDYQAGSLLQGSHSARLTQGCLRQGR